MASSSRQMGGIIIQAFYLEKASEQLGLDGPGSAEGLLESLKQARWWHHWSQGTIAQLWDHQEAIKGMRTPPPPYLLGASAETIPSSEGGWNQLIGFLERKKVRMNSSLVVSLMSMLFLVPALLSRNVLICLSERLISTNIITDTRIDLGENICILYRFSF